jgi:hypothetical protein
MNGLHTNGAGRGSAAYKHVAGRLPSSDPSGSVYTPTRIIAPLRFHERPRSCVLKGPLGHLPPESRKRGAKACLGA